MDGVDSDDIKSKQRQFDSIRRGRDSILRLLNQARFKNMSQEVKNLVQEFCNKKLDKNQGSSDWNKSINDLSDKQLEYAANDVIYLHRIRGELEKMLVREDRMDIYKKCLDFLDTRIELDQKGFKFSIFEH